MQSFQEVYSASLSCPFIMHNEGKEIFRNSPRMFKVLWTTIYVVLCKNFLQIEGSKTDKGGGERLRRFVDNVNFLLIDNIDYSPLLPYCRNYHSLNYGHFPAIYDQFQKHTKDSTIFHLKDLKLTKIS